MQKIKPTLSIVIPAYNEEKLIGACIEAVKNQTFPQDKYEILVIDNNSTDSTAKIANEKGAKIISYKDEQGFVNTKQYGTCKAQADIIVYTDADSIPEKYWLERIYSKMHNKNLMCLGGTILPTKTNAITNFLFLFFDKFAQLHQFFNISLICNANMAVRKKAFIEIGGFNTNLKTSEDWDFAMRIQKKFGLKSTLYSKKLQVKTSPRRIEKLQFLIPYIFIGILNYISIFILRKSSTYGTPTNVR